MQSTIINMVCIYALRRMHCDGKSRRRFDFYLFIYFTYWIVCDRVRQLGLHKRVASKSTKSIAIEIEIAFQHKNIKNPIHLLKSAMRWSDDTGKQSERGKGRGGEGRVRGRENKRNEKRVLCLHRCECSVSDSLTTPTTHINYVAAFSLMPTHLL